jgi:Protein of unknown function (DUF2892)
MRPLTTTPQHPPIGTPELSPPRPNGWLHWPSVNITPPERIGRVGLGLAAIIAGAFLLTSAVSVIAVVLEIFLIGAGLDLAVTGALGHCPLYAKLGHVPKSLRSSS